MIDPQTAPENVQEVIRRHLAGGHQLTNEKRTLLHNVNAFLAIEEASYTLDRDLQERIGKLDADLFEYAISVSNECLVCTTYFSRLLREEHHLDPSDFKLKSASLTRTFSNTRFPYPMSALSARRISAGSCGRNIIWTLRISS